jgi:lipopolysaccharide export system ATP-binding protein
MHCFEAINLSKAYGQRRVVDRVSLKVENDIVGILGPNGAGKTTTFYMMVGLTPPTEGSVMLNGKSVTSLPLHLRARQGIGYLPQEPSIFQNLTVRDNIYAILELNHALNTQQRHDKLDELLHEFHISHLSQVKGISLSGGERRRVEIARTLATNPKFILLDEPFAGIDPLSVIDIKTIISQLHKKGIGILITDHNVRETLDICQRAYIFNEGKVIAEGSPQEILANKTVRKVYLGDQFKM